MACKDMPLGRRLQYVLDRINRIGFGNFDMVASAYYGGNFGESSPLADEQRISRNRRLPNVLLDIFRAANEWSEWERRGLHEEVLKQTERMLVPECIGACIILSGGISRLLEAENGMCTSSPAEIVLGMTTNIRNEVCAS